VTAENVGAGLTAELAALRSLAGLPLGCVAHGASFLQVAGGGGRLVSPLEGRGPYLPPCRYILGCPEPEHKKVGASGLFFFPCIYFLFFLLILEIELLASHSLGKL
jgi:hypothetical protein